MSGWFDSFNQAVGFTKDPAEVQQNAVNAQSAASQAQLKLAKDQFDYQKSLSQPFFQASMPAFYQMVDAVTGKRQTYADPSYTKLGDSESANISEWARQNRQWKDLGVAAHYTDNGTLVQGQFAPDALLNRPSQGTYYRDANGNIVTEAPTVTTQAFNPTETDAYKWQQQQMERNTGRTLRGLGRSNSSYGMNVIADQNRNLAASEYDKQLGRLADLTNIARGGASSLASASTGYNTAAGNGILNQGNNLANASLAGGLLSQNQSNMNTQNLMSGINTGMKLYNYGKDNGWWGGSGGDTGTVDLTGRDVQGNSDIIWDV